MKSLFALLLVAAGPILADATRIKDIVSIEGVRDNQLVGYGLVVGLNGTGDKRQTVFSAQALTNILRRMGVTVDPTTVLVRNMAAVMATATLPPFAQPGTKIDVTAAAIGDASNLQGGLLVLTSLKAQNGETYAVAQGSVLTGGFVAGRGGNNTTVNHPTVGLIPGGAIVEKVPPSVAPSSTLHLQLRQPDFTTAAHIEEAINEHFVSNGDRIAHADNAAAVTVDLPKLYTGRSVEFIAEVEALTIESDRRQKVIINEKTGTVVLGKEIRLSPVAIMQGALSIEIRTQLDVSQPPPLSQGTTTVTPQTNVAAKEDKARNVVLQKGATIEDLVKALQAIGSTPRDVIAILQSMRSAGALDADIETI